jgi:hypothetical protein
MNKWETFKTYVSEHSDEIIGGAILTATVVGYAFLMKAAVKQIKLDNEVKRAQVTWINHQIDNSTV